MEFSARAKNALFRKFAEEWKAKNMDNKNGEKSFFFKKNKLQKTANFAAAKKHNDSYNTGVRKPYKLEKCVGRANSSSQKKNYTI